MGSKVTSISHLLNLIKEGQVVLPDLQRDFVWDSDKIRMLFDSIMRGYPFGSLLLWETRFLEVWHRDFVLDFRTGMTFHPKIKDLGKPMKMVLDGQQRLQSLYLGICGSRDGKRLYFNVTSGPGFKDEESEESESPVGSFRFEFWQDADQAKRPKRLVRVADIVGWSPRLDEDEIEKVVRAIPIEGNEARLAAKNMRLLRNMVTQADVMLIETIDEEATDAGQARPISEILDIFVRVNSGGTRLTQSDLMFSLIKIKWSEARKEFDELIAEVDPEGTWGIDKDFVIRGLLLVADAPVGFDVAAIERHWSEMQSKFVSFAAALRSVVDFCREPWVGLTSASLIDPVATLYPIIYYLSRQKNGNVPDSQRSPMRTLIYMLLFNRFLRGKSPQARLGWIRQKLRESNNNALPMDAILAIVKAKQIGSAITTSAEMLKQNHRLALNIVQPGVCRETLSWQVKAEVDHIFPQSIYRARYGDLVDDIGNLAYLGKLRNIRKKDEQPWDYFDKVSDEDLEKDFLVHRSLLSENTFEEFVAARRELILKSVENFLGL